MDSTLSTSIDDNFSFPHRLSRAPFAILLRQLARTVRDRFEEGTWSARLGSGCAKKGDLTVVFFTTISLFNSKLLLQFGAAGFTHFREYSHSSFPVRNGSSKIASIELHLPSPLRLHLPKKAVRLELSLIWFQECTYLYSIPCISRAVHARRRQGSVGSSMFPALITIVLSSQKPFTVNIKRIQKNINI